ncbi:MAG: hypothetical protein PVJ57_05685 [Phycisphaerae bacterium]
MEPLERVIPIARHLLTIRVDEERKDLWLWERAERVFHSSRLLSRIPEVTGQQIDLVALGAAALFHCAAWASQFAQGRVDRWQILARPTNDIQRELGAALLAEHVGHLLPPKTARLAADAIRQCNDHHTPLIEAQILAEAENLDEMGTLYVLRQFRQYQADGHPLKQITASWQRQREYRYWEVRVSSGLRFETTRRLARARLQAVDAFMEALAGDLGNADVARVLQEAGIELPAPPVVEELPPEQGH